MVENNELFDEAKDDLLNCPFCDGDNLEGNVWRLDGEEISAIECVNCLASAPIDVWQERYEPTYRCPECFECFGANLSNLVAP